jgi:hypothetical protein
MTPPFGIPPALTGTRGFVVTQIPRVNQRFMFSQLCRVNQMLTVGQVPRVNQILRRSQMQRAIPVSALRQETAGERNPGSGETQFVTGRDLVGSVNRCLLILLDLAVCQGGGLILKTKRMPGRRVSEMAELEWLPNLRRLPSWKAGGVELLGERGGDSHRRMRIRFPNLQKKPGRRLIHVHT